MFHRAVIALGVAISGCARVPLLYTDPLRESPVRAMPDELMTIAGSRLAKSDVVVYERLADTTRPSGDVTNPIVDTGRRTVPVP